MKEIELVHIAIEKLFNVAQIQATWDENTPGQFDGRLIFIFEDKPLIYNAIIKKELRNHQLIQFDKMTNDANNLIIVAQRIFPQIKRELREGKIAYLEANGNVYLKTKNNLVWIDTQATIPTTKEKGNRAFTKTGLKVLFHFLIDENLIGLTYRQIANRTNVGLGNVNNIFNGLKETRFLVKLNQNQFILNNKKELLDKWIVAYKETLKPTLEIGRFRFLKDENIGNWQNINLTKGKTWWGGEPAGDLLTNHLRPGVLTLYTLESRTELMKNYRLIPAPDGDVLVYKKFWDETLDKRPDIVPPLLVYTDLINIGDKRCRETAEMIYKDYVGPNL